MMDNKTRRSPSGSPARDRTDQHSSVAMMESGVPSAKSVRKSTVLVVDDHPVVCRGLIQLISEQDDMEVCGESDSRVEALQLVKQRRPDLVVVDISLKDGSGIDLIFEIREWNPQARVLVTSIHDESLYADRALRAGAMGYVQKQESAATLIEAIRTVASGRMYLSHRMTERLVIYALGNNDQNQASPIDNLSNRELEVFELLGHGLTSSEIAERMSLKQKTVETYREKIKQKLQLQNGNQLIQHAVMRVLQRGTEH